MIYARCAAIIAYAEWEWFEFLSEDRERDAAGRMASLKETAVQIIRLLAALRDLLTQQQRRLRDFIEDDPTSRAKTINRLRSLLAPELQIDLILERVAQFLRERLPQGHDHTRQNLRVGLYRIESGSLGLVAGFDQLSRRRNPFSSHESHPERFRLDNDTDPAQVVQAIRRRSLIIVPDTAADPSFAIHEGQLSYLKSMVAYPIIPFGAGPSTEAIGVLAIDTNVAGHFREEDRDAIEHFLTEFAARLDCEVFLHHVLS